MSNRTSIIIEVILKSHNIRLEMNTFNEQINMGNYRMERIKSSKSRIKKKHPLLRGKQNKEENVRFRIDYLFKKKGNRSFVYL